MKWQEHFKSTLPGGKTKPSLTCAEVRELAGESWPDVSDQCPTLRAARRRNRPSHGFGNSAAEGRRIGTSETAEGADARPPLTRSNVGRCSTWLTSKRKSRGQLAELVPESLLDITCLLEFARVGQYGCMAHGAEIDMLRNIRAHSLRRRN